MAFLNDEIAELLNILKSSKAREFERRRCFLMDRDQFYRALSLIKASAAGALDYDSGLTAAGYENARVAVALLDGSEYFIVCKEPHRIDTLWDGMPKK